MHPPAQKRGAGHSEFRDLNAVRRFGYAFLPGDAMSYILHLRPREWPIVAGHTLLGYLLAVGTDLTGLVRTAPVCLLVLLIWVVLLNGGTLALNSAFDADDDDVGYLDRPPPPPRYLLHFSVALLSLGFLLSFAVSRTLVFIYAVCYLLSILYSVPPFRLKAIAGADWVVNLIGFGALTPLAGWVASGRTLDAGGAAVLAGFGLLFAAFYPLTQIYQFDEDSRRGDRTLVIALGVAPSLWIAFILTIAAFFVFAFSVRNRADLAIRVAILGCSAIAWLLILARWISRQSRMNREQHKASMYHALYAWAGTDVAVLLASFL